MTRHINMRTVLFGGAILCCIIGGLFISRFAYEVFKLWSDIPHDLRSVLYAAWFYWPWLIYMLLAFAPLTMLRQSRQNKKPIWHFVIVGTAEVIVFVAFLAMLIP